MNNHDKLWAAVSSVLEKYEDRGEAMKAELWEKAFAVITESDEVKREFHKLHVSLNENWEPGSGRRPMVSDTN